MEPEMKSIGIIGGGFAGMMTAVHLIELTNQPISISIFEKSGIIGKGIAYNAYSNRQLLNVIAGKMSAFPDNPAHFIDWVIKQQGYGEKDSDLIKNSFLPRNLFGDYLQDIWRETVSVASKKGIIINVIHEEVIRMKHLEGVVTLETASLKHFQFNKCILASGNLLPRNPKIKNLNFYASPNYYRNPWKSNSVENLTTKPVLIIGNGLTMVDTVVGLMEKGFKNKIYAISPNGFNILPHRHNGLAYEKLIPELVGKTELREITQIVYKHIKSVREFGISAEPIIDALRPHTQQIWRNFTSEDKALFMRRFRHLWGVARHRIPMQIHDKIQQLRIDGRLQIIAGKLIEITEKSDGIKVNYFDKKNKTQEEISVERVINCTGPESDIELLENNYLKFALYDGLLNQDDLKLGLSVDIPTHTLLNANGLKNEGLYALGSFLKGELWESTAINELRSQAQNLAKIIITS
jgi:uncharacterized NAD(P)/FAD-binding protein YdhS